MDIKEKCCFVFSSCKQKLTLYAPYLIKEGYKVLSLYKYDNYISIGLGQLIKKKFGKKIKRKYNDKLTNIHETLIVFDSMVDIESLKWIKNNNPKARCVFAFWNPIESTGLDVEEIKRIGYDVWSYGTEQCEKYKVKQNYSFFCKSMYPQDDVNDLEKIYDICYVGKDKGRLDKIKRIIKDNNWEAYKWFLYITADHFWQRFNKKEYNKTLKYISVQRIQASAKAILEIVPSQSVDITLRAIDAMVLKRKLVTDSKNAVNMDYYNKNNVFVIGSDDSGSLEDFLDLPYVPVDKEIVEQYEIENWIDRIINDKPVNY